MVTSQSKQNAIEAIKRNVGIDIVKNGSISNPAYKDQDTRLKTILANINRYKVFAFDFDETLTVDHTRGYPYFYINNKSYTGSSGKTTNFSGKTKDTLFGQGGLAKLFAMINDIKAKGIDVYIVSRGEYAQLVTTFRDNFKINGESLLALIGGESHIYGALPTIMNAQSGLPKEKIPESKTNAQFDLGNTTWPDHKLEYLKAILEKEIQNILFFDDDHANIEALYSNAGSTMIDGIQQNKKQGLTATLAIVTELLKLRGGATATQQTRRAPTTGWRRWSTRAGNNINYPSPAGKLRSGLPHRNAPPPPSGRPAPPLPPPRQHLPIPGADNALPTLAKNRRILTFKPVTLTENKGVTTTPVVAEEPIMESLPAHKEVSRKNNKYIANANLPLPEAQRNLSKGPVITFPHPSNQHPNKTKKRFREGLLKAGEFGKAVVQGALHRMGRKQLFYGNQTEQMKPSPTKKKGFFGRLLSGTRKRVPSMGKVKRLFGRNQSKTNTEEKVPLLTKPEVTKSQKFGLGNRVLRMFGRKQSTRKSAKKISNADRHNANVELIPEDEASEIARTVPTPASSAVNQVINLFGEYNVTIHKTMVPMNTPNTKTNISNISFTKVDRTPINPTKMTLPEIPGMPDEEKNDENRLYMGKVSRAIKPIINSANEDLNRHSFNITTSDASAKMIADLKHIDTLVTELKTHYDKTQTYTKVIKNGDRLARLLDKYDVYTKTDSNPLEYIFVDNAGNIVPLDRLRLPNVEIPTDLLETAQHYLDIFKADFVSATYNTKKSEENKQYKLDLITDLNKKFESIVPNTKITESASTMPQQNNTHMPPPLPPRAFKHTQPDTLEPTPTPPLHQQIIPVTANSHRSSLSQTRTARNTTTQSSSGNKNTAQSSGNKNIPVPPPRTKKNRQQFFNIQTTIITDIHKDFLTKLTQTLSGSDNQVIKDNATAIANCINQPVSCNIQELKVSNHKESIHALLSLVLDELEVGITKRGSILSRVNLF